MNELAATMLIAATPGALPWPAALIVWGPGSASAGHRHHCVQLVMATSGELRVRPGSGERWTRCQAVLVRPDAAHEIDARGTPVLIGFVEPESDLGAALAERIAGDLSCIGADEVATWRAALGGAAPDRARVERWVQAHLLRRRRPPPIDPRVRRVLDYLRSSLAGAEDLNLPRLAAVARLSPSRFLHLFTESVGVPPRPYVLWLRLQRAAGELMGGASATHAAHEAGFSDAAHLTRTFRRMLGTTPSEMARRRRGSQGVAVGQGPCPTPSGRTFRR